ncbi:protein of unknown function [Burkholderia multivorans]
MGAGRGDALARNGLACSLSSPRAKRAGALLPGLEMKKAGIKPTFLKQMVPRRGLEPPRCCHR